MLKQQKGITLIALVITIIVLLILAGVTIAMLSGNDSTPKKANEAAAKDAVAAAKDKVNLMAIDALTDFYDEKYVQETKTGGTADDEAQKYVNEHLKSDGGFDYTADKSFSNVSVTAGSNQITITSSKDSSVSCTGDIQENGGIVWGEIVVATK